MKQTIKFNSNLFTLSFLFIAFAFVSCEKDEMQDDLSLDKRGGAAASTQNGLMYSDSWFHIAEENCAGEPIEFCFTYSGTRTVQIQQHNAVLNDWLQIYHSSNSAQHCGELVFNDAGTYLLRYSVSGQGGPNNIEFEVTAENCGCEDSLSAVLDCSGDSKVLTITFTAEEAGPIVIQGGLSSGTTIIDTNSNVLTRNETHNSAGGPSNVTRWEGDVTACEEVTITIEFTGGNGVGDWSAKRGDDVLGATEAISCQ